MDTFLGGFFGGVLGGLIGGIMTAVLLHYLPLLKQAYALYKEQKAAEREGREVQFWDDDEPMVEYDYAGPRTIVFSPNDKQIPRRMP